MGSLSAHDRLPCPALLKNHAINFGLAQELQSRFLSTLRVYTTTEHRHRQSVKVAFIYVIVFLDELVATSPRLLAQNPTQPFQLPFVHFARSAHSQLRLSILSYRLV